jgi:hypothetical protein
MIIFVIAALIIFVLIIVLRIRPSFRNYKAALNCLMAKAAFEQASDDLQSKAVYCSWQVLKNMGFNDPQEKYEKMSEVEKCAVLALAFAEMGTPPPFKKDSWHSVSRPFIDILKQDAAFAAAHRHLKITYGVDIKF